MDFFIGITNKCNLNCPWCAHKRFRSLEPSYEMKKDEFEQWYSLTRKAGYTFESIDFNGLGEPTVYSDTDFLKYMVIRCSHFTENVNILTNGLKVDILEKLLPYTKNITISVWKEQEEIQEFHEKYPRKVHLRRNILLHDVNTPYTEISSSEIGTCGCSGCGYTMETVFLVCGTWCPKIVKNQLYHTNLTEYYLHTLDKRYGTTSYPMCQRCHANETIPYKPYEA